MWGQALNTPTSPLPAEEQGGGRGGEAEGRVAQPQLSWGKRGQVQRPVLILTWPPPTPGGGERGEAPRNSDPSPHLPLAPAAARLPPCP